MTPTIVWVHSEEYRQLVFSGRRLIRIHDGFAWFA